MGHKINPKALRLGITYPWESRWFARTGHSYQKLLLEDYKIRKLLFERLKGAGLGKVEIERSINKLNIILYVSRPGIVIGRGGQGLEEVKKAVQASLGVNKKAGKSNFKIEIKVEPIKQPYLVARLVAQTIADQLVKRMPHRRAIKFAVSRVMEAGAHGVKIMLSGRIAGAEISRVEKYHAGKVPLSTIREEIDYAELPALTRSGYIGIKVWICK